jgi:diaminopimelate decarboxylase
MELDLAIKLGFDKIIFNGPIKKDEAFRKAIAHHAIINLDSVYEIDYICQYKREHPGVELKIGLRVNVRLTDENGQSTIQCGLREGRFGFSYQILGENINRLREAGIAIVALHGHTSSSDRAVANYKVITEYMLSVCEDFQLNDLRYFDLGGGFFGAAPEGMDTTGMPSYEDYANEIMDIALRNKWFVQQQPSIVIEPGVSVVSNVFTYYMKVYQIKHIGSKNFVIVDGTVFDVKPTMHTNNLPYTVISDNQEGESGLFDVVGSTCMEKDIILHDVELNHIKAGDYIEIKGVGAYTIALTPTFINYQAPIISIENGEKKLIRRRQELSDVISIYE